MVKKIFLICCMVAFTCQPCFAGTKFKKVNVRIDKNENNKKQYKFALFMSGYKYPLVFQTKRQTGLCNPMNDETPMEVEVIGETECDMTSNKYKILIPYEEGQVIDITPYPIIRLEYPKVYYSIPPNNNLPASFFNEIEFPAIFPNGSFRVRTSHETECLAGGWCYQDGEYDPQGTYGIRNCSGDPDNLWFNYIILTKIYRVFEDEKGNINFCVYYTDKEVYTIIRNKDGYLVKDKDGKKVSASKKLIFHPW